MDKKCPVCKNDLGERVVDYEKDDVLTLWYYPCPTCDVEYWYIAVEGPYWIALKQDIISLFPVSHLPDIHIQYSEA